MFRGQPTAEQKTMEDLLYESIEHKWGSAQLPDMIDMIKDARTHFGLGLVDANNLVKRMLEKHRADLETMGYNYSTRIPAPPKYQG